MLDLFAHIIKVITDSTQRWTTRSAVVILIFLSLWLLNDTFEFIHSFRTNNRLSQLVMIDQLLQDSTLNSDERSVLVKERHYVLTNQTTLEKLSVYIDSLPDPFSLMQRKMASRKKSNLPMNKLETKNGIAKAPVEKQYWLNFISSNIFIILVMLIVPFQISYKENRPWVLLIALIVVYGFTFIICAVVSYLFNLIPVIIGRPWINYVLNVILQFLLWIVIAGIVSTLSKTNKTKV